MEAQRTPRFIIFRTGLPDSPSVPASPLSRGASAALSGFSARPLELSYLLAAFIYCNIIGTPEVTHVNI